MEDKKFKMDINSLFHRLKNAITSISKFHPPLDYAFKNAKWQTTTYLMEFILTMLKKLTTYYHQSLS